MLKKDFPLLRESISYTTRLPRDGEQDGLHYFFITDEKFKEMLEESAFIEWAQVHSHFYGTSKSIVQEALDNGNHLLFDLDVQGADEMKRLFREFALAIFIAPPSVEDLKKRLLKRATDDVNTINERIENAKKELLKKDNYDFCIVNDDIEKAYGQLKKIVLENVK